MSLAKFLDADAFAKYPPEEYMQDKDIIINSTGKGTLGRIGIFHDTDRISDSIIVPDSHVTIIRASRVISLDYVYYVLRYYQPFLESLEEGSTNQTELKPAVISQLLFPLPPREEQNRIADKLILIKPFIDKYNHKENTLLCLNKDFPNLLKKSILQEAVMRKLVPQDENDEPASVLLEHIREEKQRLMADGKLKKDKHESIIYRRDNSHYEKLDGVERCIDDEIPFEIPETWVWERFGNIMINRDSERIPLSVNERSKLEKKYDYYGASGVIDKIDNYLFDTPLLLIVEDGANLLNRSTPIAFIATVKHWVNNHAHVLDAPEGISLEYISLFINSMSLAKYVTGTAQPLLNSPLVKDEKNNSF